MTAPDRAAAVQIAHRVLGLYGQPIEVTREVVTALDAAGSAPDRSAIARAWTNGDPCPQ